MRFLKVDKLFLEGNRRNKSAQYAVHGKVVAVGCRKQAYAHEDDSAAVHPIFVGRNAKQPIDEKGKRSAERKSRDYVRGGAQRGDDQVHAGGARQLREAHH